MKRFQIPLLILAVCLFMAATAAGQPGKPSTVGPPANAGPPAQAGPPANPGPPAHAGPPPGVTTPAVPGTPVNVIPTANAGPSANPGPPANAGPPVNAGPPSQVGPPFLPPADGPATVNVVHGIPGVVVKVCVAGDAVLTSFNFGEIAALELDEGEYEVVIVAGNAECSGTPLLGPFDAVVEGGANYSIVAHLNAAGDPAVSAFENSQEPNDPGNARLVVHHLAAAPPVQAVVGRLSESDLDFETEVIANIASGGEPFVGELRPGNWKIELFAEDGEEPILSLPKVQFHPKTSYLIYVVGDADELVVLSVDVGLPPV